MKKKPLDLDEYVRLKKLADARRRDEDRAKGALESVRGEVRKRWGVATIAELKVLLKAKAKERDALTERFEAEMAKVRKELEKHEEDRDG